MQIVGGKGGPINSIGLQLGSTNTKYKLIMRPFEPDYDGSAQWQHSNDILIHFHDSRELDTLIYMLQKFRAKNHDYIGDWMEVKENGSA